MTVFAEQYLGWPHDFSCFSTKSGNFRSRLGTIILPSCESSHGNEIHSASVLGLDLVYLGIMVDPDWETFWEISLGCILGIYCPGEWEKLFGSPNKYHKMTNGAHSNSKTQKVRDFLVVPRMIFHTINLNDHKSLEYTVQNPVFLL